MGYTKLDFVKMAFNALNLADYVYSLSADQLNACAVQLDAMMGQLNIYLRFPYPFASSPSTLDINRDSNIPDWANEAIYTNLAVRLASSYGAVVPIETKTIAKQGWAKIVAQGTNLTPMQYQMSTIAGAGNKPWMYNFSPFLRPPVNLVDGNTDGPVDFGGSNLIFGRQAQ